MHFSYAVAKKPNGPYREISVAFRPFPSNTAIPNKALRAHLHRPPWGCVRLQDDDVPAIEFPGVLWEPGSAGRRAVLAAFECPRHGTPGHLRHKMVGAYISAFTKSDPTDFTFWCEASVPVEAVQTALENLGRAILEQAGGYITGGYAVVPVGIVGQRIPAGGKQTIARRIKA